MFVYYLNFVFCELLYVLCPLLCRFIMKKKFKEVDIVIIPILQRWKGRLGGLFKVMQLMRGRGRVRPRSV